MNQRELDSARSPTPAERRPAELSFLSSDFAQALASMEPYVADAEEVLDAPASPPARRGFTACSRRSRRGRSQHIVQNRLDDLLARIGFAADSFAFQAFAAA